MRRTDVEDGGIAASRRDLDGPALVIRAGGLAVARQIGPLPWTALQHLALASRATDDGWAAATGVRDIAAGIGVTKDTAARAVSTLIAAGLLTRGLVQSTGGRRRCGYLLRLPGPFRLIDGPNRSDGLAEHRHPVSNDYAGRSAPSIGRSAGRRRRRPRGSDSSGEPAAVLRPAWDQPQLFGVVS